MIFFFSSRRRHTRWTGDWSSDVCSSDLFAPREITDSDMRQVLERGFQMREPGDRQVIHSIPVGFSVRSEERRVGKECRWRWWRGGYKKKWVRKLKRGRYMYV